MKVEINAMKSQEVNKKKSQKLLASRAGSSKQTIAHTVFTQPAIEIGWIPIECFDQATSVELARRAVSAIFCCWKMMFRDLTAFCSFLLRENLVFFRYSY